MNRHQANWFRVSSLSVLIFVASQASALDGTLFPLTPDSTLTPGSVCQHPSERRYHERISYCERSVSTRAKDQVIENYDQQLHFSIGELKRSDFKIDHFIPLSLGGSNESSNLWPQHRSVYTLTDPVEEKLFRLLSTTRITQAEAIATIKHVKNNVDESDEINEDLEGLLKH